MGMRTMKCDCCGGEFERLSGRIRRHNFCETACRVRFNRAMDRGTCCEEEFCRGRETPYLCNGGKRRRVD